MEGAGARIVTSCFGTRYARMALAWCRMLRRVTDLPITILALDGNVFPVDVRDVTVIPYAGLTDLKWGSSDAPRTAFIVDRLAAGETCIQIDMDIYLKAPIEPILDLPFDFLISRSFGILPREMVEAHGFEACSGFYVAKPNAALLLRTVIDRMESGREHVERTDQYATNMLLIDASWKHGVTVEGDVSATSAAYSTCEAFDARVCVLDGRDIGRDYDVASTRYGNHGGRFCWLYENDVLPESFRGRAYIAFQRQKYPWVMRRRAVTRWVMRKPLALRARRSLLARSSRVV